MKTCSLVRVPDPQNLWEGSRSWPAFTPECGDGTESSTIAPDRQASTGQGFRMGMRRKNRPPALGPKRAAQTAAQGIAPADTPGATTNQKKRDTSNEVRKGTFLKGFDRLVRPR